MSSERKVAGVVRGDGFHWVGDGFHVTNLFPSGNAIADRLSPFLLMDYHAPYQYTPTERPRGVGVHPHRGFETVTLAFEGTLAHHDSTGQGGIITPGDAQWMTAARGILHKEYHERAWARAGGTMHMMQLWVNLPAAAKMDTPRYQALTGDQMALVQLGDGSGTVKVIAGEYGGVRGPAETVTPVNLWELNLRPGGRAEMSFDDRDNAGLFVLDGSVTVNGVAASKAELVLFDNAGNDVRVDSAGGAHLLLLGGEPIREQVMAYGPFVMNTKEEIIRAVEDYNAGAFGHLDD